MAFYFGEVITISLRDLIVAISFDLDSSPLDSVNSQIDSFTSNLGESADGVDTLTSSTDDAIGTAGGLGDALDDAGTQGSEAIEGVNDSFNDLVDNSSSGSNLIVDNWGKITVASAAAGGAIEGFARSQSDTNAVLERASIATGENADALRDSISAMVNHTFSAHDAAAGMEFLISKGIDTKEQFEAILPAVDDLADATGQDFTAAMESADRMLRPFGQTLEDVGESSDQMTRLITQTDIPLSTLERNLGRIPDELQALEFGLDDAAAGIEYFRDQGFSGQEAVREFRKAVEESEGDMSEFLNTLGITNDEWEEYQAAVEPATGLTQDLAAANNEQMTVMEKLQANVSNLMFNYGDLLHAMNALVPLFLVLGPLIKGISVAKGAMALITGGGLVTSLGAAATATWTFTAALLANPITWIVIAIIGLIAVIWLLWANWDTVSAWLVDSWEWIKETSIMIFEAVRDWLIEVFTAIGEFILQIWTSIKEWTIETWNSMVETISNALNTALEWIVTIWNAALEFYITILTAIWEFVSTTFMNIYNTISEWLTTAYNTIMEIWNNASAFVSEILNTIWDTIKTMFSSFVDTIREWMNNAYDTIVEIWNNAQSFLEGIDLVQIGKDIIQGLIDGIGQMADKVWGKVTEIADGIKDRFTSALSIFSPSRVFKGFGIDTMLGYQIGFEDQAEHVHSLVDDTAEGIKDGFDPDVSASHYTPEKAPVSTSNHQQVVFNDTYNINVEGDADQSTLDMLESRMRELHEELFRKRMEVYNKRMNAKYV